VGRCRLFNRNPPCLLVGGLGIEREGVHLYSRGAATKLHTCLTYRASAIRLNDLLVVAVFFTSEACIEAMPGETARPVHIAARRSALFRVSFLLYSLCGA